MDLRSIFVSNGIGVFLLGMLMYTSRTRALRRNTEDKLFSFMLFGVMIACMMEVFSFVIDGQVFPGARILNYIANTYLYSVNMLLPFSVLAYVDLGLYEDRSRIWKHYKPQIIIAVFMFICNIVNFFIPISYYITAQNVYERRPFSYAYYIVILYFCISAIITTHRYEKENGTRTFFSIHVFLIPILVGAGLQFMFYGFSLGWLSAAVGLTGLYMMQQNETAYIDPLVDTYNRTYMNQLLLSWTRKSIRFVGVMLDIDKFKSINDRFGHSEGDHALKELTSILKKAKIKGEKVFRFAGDEFIVLKMGSSEDDFREYLAAVEKLIEERNRKTTAYSLNISYGVTVFDSMDLDSFMKDMDDKMYQMKNKHHQAFTEEPADADGR